MSVTQTNTPSENRLIVLTDVCDSSLSSEKGYLEEHAEKGINTTIIGISEEFQSNICEVFKNVKGFNYFSATKDEDLKKYLFENFDYTFFPANYDLQIELESDSITDIKVFGSPDSDNVQEYNKSRQKGSFIVAKIGTSFPSDISIKEGVMHTFGGLILIKLSNSSETEHFKVKVNITCKDLQMKEIKKSYDISYHIPVKEQFFSEESVQEALDSYQYVSEIKALLKEVNQATEEKERKERWMGSLSMLEKVCPKSKAEELEKLAEIIKKRVEK